MKSSSTGMIVAFGVIRLNFECHAGKAQASTAPRVRGGKQGAVVPEGIDSIDRNEGDRDAPMEYRKLRECKAVVLCYNNIKAMLPLSMQAVCCFRFDRDALVAAGACPVGLGLNGRKRCDRAQSYLQHRLDAPLGGFVV